MMKNMSLMPIVLALTMGLVGSNLYAAESKPTPSPAPTPTLAETAGKAAASAGSDFIKGLGSTAVKAGAAAIVPPLPPLNFTFDNKVVKCNNGDDSNIVEKSTNVQIQNIRGECNQRIGATGDAAEFKLPASVTLNDPVRSIENRVLFPNIAYKFTFGAGLVSAALAAKVIPKGSSLEVVIYTTRSKGLDRWTERYRFGVEGDISQGIAPIRLYPDGTVEIFFAHPESEDLAVRFRFNILSKRTIA